MGYLLDKSNKIKNLSVVHPELTKEWNYKKNFSLTPDQISYGSGKLVWWVCKFGHEWKASVHHRHRGKHNCPECLLENKNKNAILYTNPECLKHWDYSKNIIKPEDISAGSEQIVFWKCDKCLNTWSDSFCNYIKNINKCPECRKNKVLTISKKYPEILKLWDYERNIIDPNNIAVNSRLKVWWKCKNGHTWKKSIINTTKKLERGNPKEFCSVCNSLGYKRPDLIKEIFYDKSNIDPFKVSCLSDKKIWWVCKYKHKWAANISTRTREKSSNCPICSYIKKRKPLRSLLRKEWDYIRNKDLNIDKITSTSDEKVWWMCSICGSSWRTSVGNRTLGHNCKKCCKVTDKNTIVNKCPKMEKEYSRKNIVSSKNITYGSKRKCMWVCSKGHEWEDTPVNRYKKKSGCPYCYDIKLYKENSLSYKDKYLSKEWNYAKNDKLTPNSVIYKSSKNVWWICSICGHEWQASIRNRHIIGSGCPNCCKNVLLKNGIYCDSLVEAYFYLLYSRNKNKKFLHNKRYPLLKRHKYDFYFPESNTYVEVTGYHKGSERFQKYMNTIELKRNHVEKVLGSTFILIQKIMSKKEYKYVKNNIIKYNKKVGGY